MSSERTPQEGKDSTRPLDSNRYMDQKVFKSIQGNKMLTYSIAMRLSLYGCGHLLALISQMRCPISLG